MESPLNDCGPLKTSDNECVGLWSFCFHQLAFWNKEKEREEWGEKGGV